MNPQQTALVLIEYQNDFAMILPRTWARGMKRGIQS